MASLTWTVVRVRFMHKYKLWPSISRWETPAWGERLGQSRDTWRGVRYLQRAVKTKPSPLFGTCLDSLGRSKNGDPDQRWLRWKKSWLPLALKTSDFLLLECQHRTGRPPSRSCSETRPGVREDTNPALKQSLSIYPQSLFCWLLCFSLFKHLQVITALSGVSQIAAQIHKSRWSVPKAST